MVDGDPVVNPVALPDPLYVFAPEDVTEVDNVAQTVDDCKTEPDTDCEGERVLHGDAVYETDPVPHGLADTAIDSVGETVVLADPQDEPVADDTYDAVAFGEADGVDEIDGEEEASPDTDCKMERVPHSDVVGEVDDVVDNVGHMVIVPDTDCEPVLDPQDNALRVPFTDPLGLNVDGGDGVVAPVELTDPQNE